MVMMVVVMAAAGAVLVVLVMVVMVMLVLLIMVMMVMMLLVLVVVVAAALAIMVVMMMLVVVIIIVVIMVVVMVVLLLVLIMVMMVLFLLQTLAFQSRQLCCQRGLALHGGNQLLTGELAPGGGDDGGNLVVLPQQLHGGIQLGLGNGIGTGQDDGGGSLHLIIVEFSEVLGIDLDLARIHNSHGVAQGHIRAGHLVNRADNIGQLAHAGGLDDDPVGMVLPNHLLQGLAEVTHQRAADAAGVHLRNIDVGILQEAAVNADLAELILNQHQLLALVALGNHLLDQRSLASAQEAGVNINLCHK